MVNKKKIALIGNMNNTHFALARYLKDLEYEVNLFLINEQLHFFPHCDSFSTDFENYTFELDWLKIGWWDKKKKDIWQDLKNPDFIISTDWAAAFLNKAKIKSNIFDPHGSDIFSRPYYKFKHFPPKKWEASNFFRARAQLLGIRNSKYFFFEHQYPKFEEFVTKLKIRGERIYMGVPFLYIKEYDMLSTDVLKNKQTDILRQLKKENKFLVFHHSRHHWKGDKFGLNKKGNDLIFLGMSKLFKENPSLKDKMKLVTFDYGVNVSDSKQLIESMNLQDNVIWFPQSMRKEIMIYLKFADLGVGELGRTAFSYGAVYEYLASGVAFIGNREDSFYPEREEMYPMLKSIDENTFAQALKFALENPIELKKIALGGRKWFNNYGVRKPLNKIVSLIEADKN